jgi:hypothetical protein
MYSTTPNDHTSTARVYLRWFEFSRISGATSAGYEPLLQLAWTYDLHDGVPQRVVVNDSSPMIFARPKSANFTCKFLSVRSIFSGLISRCTMLRSCYSCSVSCLQVFQNGLTKYLTAWNNCTNTLRASDSVSFCFMTIQLKSSPSVASSRTR